MNPNSTRTYPSASDIFPSRIDFTSDPVRIIPVSTVSVMA